MDPPILVTGATSGLGAATARILVERRGAEVVLTGRQATRAEPLARELGARAVSLDLGSLQDVAAAVGRLQELDALPLRALIANAGTQVTRATTSRDGYEATFAVNHLGHLALIVRLLEVGGIARGGRIVIVSSGTHDAAARTGMPPPLAIDVAALSCPAPESESVTQSRQRYATSKLANVMSAYALARRLEPLGITVNAFDPGLMPGTGLAREGSRIERLAWSTVLRAAVVIPGVSTPRRSGAVLADLAAGPGREGLTGRYFTARGERRSSAASYEVAVQDALWRESLELLDLVDPTAPPA